MVIRCCHRLKQKPDHLDARLSTRLMKGVGRLGGVALNDQESFSMFKWKFRAQLLLR
jgi:hypothetical protein